MKSLQTPAVALGRPLRGTFATVIAMLAYLKE
jgi:hypothetical protein